MATTTKGRVVYNRKPHLFTYADVLRIIRKVEVPEEPEKPWIWAGNTSAASLAALADFLQALDRLPVSDQIELALDFSLKVASFLVEVASYIPQYGGRIVQALFDSPLGDIVLEEEESLPEEVPNGDQTNEGSVRE